MTDQVNEAVRDREADRQRFSDPDFNHWLDEVISDAGHTVWCAIGDTQAAWAGWENRQWYTHPARGVVDEVIAALDQISGLTRALRNGGPAPEDLQELSDALTEATNVAWCASRALQAAQPAVPSVPEVCRWTFDDDDYAPKWDTSCGEAYCFIEGGPEDNRAKFCHGCGKPISTAAPKDQPAQGVG